RSSFALMDNSRWCMRVASGSCEMLSCRASNKAEALSGYVSAKDSAVCISRGYGLLSHEWIIIGNMAANNSFASFIQ
ncbi:hypothetical protein, partial [Bacteroides heparinolyticus]|uniref:hypothetical protein n=1 Tax=Prevotella heparinolytica TaxID=28113 RepID=UPI0035A15C28